jgi:hypothetical protein
MWNTRDLPGKAQEIKVLDEKGAVQQDVRRTGLMAEECNFISIAIARGDVKVVDWHG